MTTQTREWPCWDEFTEELHEAEADVENEATTVVEAGLADDWTLDVDACERMGCHIARLAAAAKRMRYASEAALLGTSVLAERALERAIDWEGRAMRLFAMWTLDDVDGLRCMVRTFVWDEE